MEKQTRRGQKPYECIRKDWHNDTHQTMRGSIIQEIFRVVSETHSLQTKQNKEWQQKLPIVILKAEEMMYSKADSETEYMDLETLCERIIDAINTIIRRGDESTETGDLLQPCIEAALILGCTARKGSRSQQYTRSSYLSNNTKEPNSECPSIIDNAIHGSFSDLLSILSSEPSSTSPTIAYNSNPARLMAMNSTQLHMESGSPHTQLINTASMSYAFPFSSENTPSSRDDQAFPIESNLGYTYPLYYGAHHQAQYFDRMDFSPVQPGPSYKAQSILIPNEKGFLHNFFTCNGVVNASNKNTGEIQNTDEIPPEIECDLSLHLGPLSVSCTKTETSWSRQEVASSSSQQGSRSYEPSLRTSMKRKATVTNLVEAGHFSYHPKFSSPELFFGRFKKLDK